MTYPLIQSIGIVAFDGDRVLLVRQGKASKHFDGICGLPAGKIDEGETAIQAAAREFREETGLVCSIDDLQQLPKTYRATIEQKDGIKIFDWHVFLCKKYSGKLIATDETAPFWVTVKELNSMQLLPNVQDAVREALIVLNP